MLTASITDIANQAWQQASAAAASSPQVSTIAPSSASDGGGVIQDVFEIARLNAEAEKRKATWLLVGVGVGALLFGVLIGRYAIPAKRRRR